MANSKPASTHLDSLPGAQIRDRKEKLKDMVLTAVQEFESVTSVQIQSVHYYIGESDSKTLDRTPKLKVDIILKL